MIYTSFSYYLITLCCEDRKHLFGKVEQGRMILNEAGMVADACWLEIPVHFPNAVLHAHVVMPNHVHGIIELSGARAENFLPLPLTRHEFQKMIPRSIGSIVRGFKIGVTKWFRNREGDPGRDQPVKIWQRNYHERIIRDLQSNQNISKYIHNNPLKWKGN